MNEDEDRLRECADLRRLLEHYNQVSAGDPEAWQDRLSELPATSAKQLVQLHGELIAHDWLEQNTGVVILRQPGVVAACYRVSAAGRRALRRTADGTAARAA
jgi:hypothetical protein